MPNRNDPTYATVISDRLIAHLTEVNAQLEQFAYVASHDLREPLRTIVCFTDLLEKEYGDQLDQQARRYMALNRQAACRMEALVADMLEYGRSGHYHESRSRADIGVILKQCIELLSETITASNARIEYGSMPVLLTQPVKAQRLLQNLISNAIKYQPPGQQPHISVVARERASEWWFEVADNGIGIKEEYLETIFDPFKRLHSQSEYPGSGIGLAICRRIAENLGGRIWVTSSPGHGSVFSFSLPKDAAGGEINA